MNNLALTKASTTYQQACQATNQLEEPALGFIKPSDYQGAYFGTTALIKQNNTQLQILVQIAETLKDIQADIKTLLEVSRAGTQIPETLITKLENLLLGTREKPKESRGVLRVFKDPFHILQEEKEKLVRRRS